MDNTKDHQLIVHTKESKLGHFSLEIKGPSIAKETRYLRGFGPQTGIKEGISITTFDVTGTVRNDEQDMVKNQYLHSEPVAITRKQAERIQSFVKTLENSPPDYDLNDYNCVDFVNDMIKTAGLPGDVDSYLTKAQKEDMSGAQFYNDWVYGGPERPSMVDPLVDHATAFNTMINGAKYNSLTIELRREGAPTSLLDEIERGLTNQKWSKDERINPSLGAAIMHGIEGHDLLSNPLPGGFSALEKVASVRAQNVYERTGSAVEAARAAVDGVREAQKYSGPSQDVSPEDTLTPSQNRAQLAMNTKVLEARRASLLDGGVVSINGVPANAMLSAGATNASTALPTRAGAQKLYEQKAASLHPDPVAARRAVRTTLPEQFSLPDFSNLFFDAVDGPQNVLGVKTAAAKAPAIARGQLESAKIAGLVMDQPMADKVMTSKAYQTKTDPLNGFATKAACRFEYAFVV